MDRIKEICDEPIYDDYEDNELDEIYCVGFNLEHLALKVEPLFTLTMENFYTLKPYERERVINKVHYDPIGFAFGRQQANELAEMILEGLAKEYGEIKWVEYP